MIAASTLKDMISYLEWIYDLNDDIEKITKDCTVGQGYQSRSIVNLTYMREWKAAIEEQ